MENYHNFKIGDEVVHKTAAMGLGKVVNATELTVVVWFEKFDTTLTHFKSNIDLCFRKLTKLERVLK